MAYYFERTKANIHYYSSWQCNRAQIWVTDLETHERFYFIITDRNKKWNNFTASRYNEFIFEGERQYLSFTGNIMKNIKILDKLEDKIKYAEYFIYITYIKHGEIK